MNIEQIINYLNKTYAYNISSDYYKHIKVWQDWWKGFYAPFHEYRDGSGEHSKKRKLYTLKMAKKVAEDWASLLLNEKTEINISDKATDEYIKGISGSGGFFGESEFWEKGNQLIERSFAMGTGAFVIKAENIGVNHNGNIVADTEASLYVDTIDALGIIPITVRHKKIIEAAFVSEVVEKGSKYAYVEIHRLVKGLYEIENIYLKVSDSIVKKHPLPEGVAEIFSTGSKIPFFVIVTPAIVNTFEKANGMGQSVYANAIDNLMGVDLAYNNFNRDFKLGGKKVFYDKELIKVDQEGNSITPDDVAQQLFVELGDSAMLEGDRKDPIHEYNPSLRVTENKEGVQAQLDYLSFKCGLGAKRYRFDAGTVVTATQYVGDKQDLMQYVNKHYIHVKNAIVAILKAAMFAAKEYLGVDIDPEADIDIKFDDSYINDQETKKEQDRQDVREGLMKAWEYRVKWYGETEEEAKAILEENNDFIEFEDGEDA